jgi:hypothetical protein
VIRSGSSQSCIVTLTRGHTLEGRRLAHRDTAHQRRVEQDAVPPNPLQVIETAARRAGVEDIGRTPCAGRAHHTLSDGSQCDSNPDPHAAKTRRNA